MNDPGLVLIGDIHRLVLGAALRVHQSEHLFIGIAGVAVLDGIGAVIQQRALFRDTVNHHLAVPVGLHIVPGVRIVLVGLHRPAGVGNRSLGIFDCVWIISRISGCLFNPDDYVRPIVAGIHYQLQLILSRLGISGSRLDGAGGIRLRDSVVLTAYQNVFLGCIRSICVDLAALAGFCCVCKVFRLRISCVAFKGADSVFGRHFVVLVICFVHILGAVFIFVHRQACGRVGGGGPLQDGLRHIAAPILRPHVVLIVIIFPVLAYQNIGRQGLVVHGQGRCFIVPIRVCLRLLAVTEEQIVEHLPPARFMVVISFQCNGLKLFIHHKGIDGGVCRIACGGLCFLNIVGARLLEFHQSFSVDLCVNHIGLNVSQLHLQVCFHGLGIRQGIFVTVDNFVVVIILPLEGVVLLLFRIRAFDNALHIFLGAVGVDSLLVYLDIIVVQSQLTGDGVPVHRKLCAFQQHVGSLGIPLGDGDGQGHISVFDSGRVGEFGGVSLDFITAVQVGLQFTAGGDPGDLLAAHFIPVFTNLDLLGDGIGDPVAVKVGRQVFKAHAKVVNIRLVGLVDDRSQVFFLYFGRR